MKYTAAVTVIFAQSQDDYIFADIALVTDTLSYSIDLNGSNPYQIEGFIRGYDVQGYELWFYGEYGSYHQHVDGSRLPQSASYQKISAGRTRMVQTLLICATALRVKWSGWFGAT